jgi:hypothetical protein
MKKERKIYCWVKKHTWFIVWKGVRNWENGERLERMDEANCLNYWGLLAISLLVKGGSFESMVRVVRYLGRSGALSES